MVYGPLTSYTNARNVQDCNRDAIMANFKLLRRQIKSLPCARAEDSTTVLKLERKIKSVPGPKTFHIKLYYIRPQGRGLTLRQPVTCSWALQSFCWLTLYFTLYFLLQVKPCSFAKECGNTNKTYTLDRGGDLTSLQDERKSP